MKPKYGYGRFTQNSSERCGLYDVFKAENDRLLTIIIASCGTLLFATATANLIHCSRHRQSREGESEVITKEEVKLKKNDSLLIEGNVPFMLRRPKGAITIAFNMNPKNKK
ncbi:hypothetical protein Avbf_01481 [Armadillidium vulgare]|nr:hypothetical protein Avbf_01481 [Armadillidium vulgare]